MLLDERILGKNFKVALISDFHVGNKATSYDSLYETIEMIGSNNWYWLMGGDAIEAKYVGHPHFDPNIHEGKYGLIQAQCDEVIDIVSPIKKRCVAWIEGNHEQNRGVQPIMKAGKYITEKLGLNVPVAFTVKTRLAENYTQFYTHGRFTCNSMAGDPDQIYLNECVRVKRKLWRLPGVADCHVVSTAHIHKLRLRPPVEELDIIGLEKLKSERNSIYKSETGNSLSKDSKYYCSTGSFLRSTIAKKYAPGVEDALTYSERGMYSQTEIGFILVTVEKGYVVNVEEIKL